MYEHHAAAIENITEKLKARKDILGIIVGGSVAHGFAGEDSDIDLMLVLSEQDYADRLKSGQLTYFETEACSYDGGYVDAKYTSLSFIGKVAESGSEPARFAYKDAFVSYSEIEGLEQLIAQASRYPVEKKQENVRRFYAQFEAWKWYCQEGLRKNNRYLIDFSASNFILFGGRLILAYNETLYPYQKWFLKVLESVGKKPDSLLRCINELLEHKNQDTVEQLYRCIVDFNKWPPDDRHWASQFMLDSELNWLSGQVPIADI